MAVLRAVWNGPTDASGDLCSLRGRHLGNCRRVRVRPDVPHGRRTELHGPRLQRALVHWTVEQGKAAWDLVHWSMEQGKAAGPGGSSSITVTGPGSKLKLQ